MEIVDNHTRYTQTRDNNLKIYQDHVHYNLTKYSFSYRVIHVWNSLPNEVMEANSTNSFKNRLDKHWYNEDIKYDWKTELSGTGSCS